MYSITAIECKTKYEYNRVVDLRVAKSEFNSSNTIQIIIIKIQNANIIIMNQAQVESIAWRTNSQAIA